MKFEIRQSPGYLINILARVTAGALQKAFKAAGYEITAPQWTVLNFLWEEEGIHQEQLAANITRDRHNLSRIIDVMVRRGLVEKHNDPRDRRKTLLFLTPYGRELEKKLPSIAARTARQVFKGVSPGDIDALVRVCRRIMRNIELTD